MQRFQNLETKDLGLWDLGTSMTNAHGIANGVYKQGGVHCVTIVPPFDDEFLSDA